MVWLLPFGDNARLAIIIITYIVTYIVGLGVFAHVVAAQSKDRNSSSTVSSR